MAVYSITKGLDLPISGEPTQAIEPGRRIGRVAVVAADYVGMKPKLHVAVGDAVKRGQLLFEDKKTVGVRYTAPGAGEVLAVNRGERRAFQSVVIGLTDAEQAGNPSDDQFQAFENYAGKDIGSLTREDVRNLLVESGLWTVLRTRPFGKVPSPEADSPCSIFVTAINTNPLAASVDVVLEGRMEDFHAGLQCLTKLTDGKVRLCKAPGGMATTPVDGDFETAEFAGPHPAGNVGTHIHLVDPVHRGKIAWYLNYQDVIAIGRLLKTGRLDVERVISLAGPTVKQPRLLQTRVGVSIDELVADELEPCENRVVSGSVLSGRTAMGDVLGYLGRYHLQVSALAEGRHREFLSWLMPGLKKFSTIPAFLGKLLPKKVYDFTTTRHGGDRAIVPIGLYERVMPLDIPATALLRSLAAGDIESAEKLGALELEEEDLALCTFVCPSKIEFGPILRENLTVLEREG